MCRMLLSIKPEHVENILSEKKRFEFRKVRCKAGVDKIIIYSTAPVMRVVAEATLDEIIEDDISTVWKITNKYAGIPYEYYINYYKGKSKAIAYHLRNVVEYEHPLTLSEIGLSYAPQSFVYLSSGANEN